jgi:D-alanyl-D-alanine carboxypeptidase/D-alanyl-D-alanine-endopeptidase (penicillin-binding protein 4)
MLTDRPILSRRTVLSGLLATVAAPAIARAPTRSPYPPARPGSIEIPQPPQAVTTRRPLTGLADILARSGLSGETAVIALDAETGGVIEEHRANLLLPPASTAKAVTAMYALQSLGPEHRFVTRVLARDGAIEGGTLRGDLVLQGGGDPVLQTADLARLADTLIERGLRRIEGRFLIDANALPTIEEIDRGQPVQAGYNPAVSGINLNFNRVHFAWEVQGGRASVSMDARSDREIPRVSAIEMRAVSRDLPVYTHELRSQTERWTVASSALRSSGSRWLPVHRPAEYAGDVLRALLLARGCRVPEPTVTRSVQGGTVLAEHYSEPLTSILRGMLQYSTNLTAETVGLTATAHNGHRVRALSPSASRMNEWAAAAHDAHGMRFVDHSGLGEGSRVSPRVMATYLRSAFQQGTLPNLLRDHPLRDPQGQQMRNHPISVQAKTGTLNFVSALSGYAHPRNGRPIVFSIMSADLPRRRAIRDDAGERPPGTRTWTGRARVLQQDLIERWGQAHG